VADVLKFWARKYLRLAPLYYLTFFCGWALFPYVGAGPIWYTANLMYDECSQYWWAQLLMIGNLYPMFQAPNYGCFFWGWTITTDLQLALLTPLFVVMYIKREWLGHVFVTVVTLGQLALIGWVCYEYKLRVGPFAAEDWYLFSMFQKPFFKIESLAMGVTAAFFYMKVLRFRRISDEATRKAEHPWINKVHQSTLCHVLMFSTGLALVLANLLAGHSAIASPYSWSMQANISFYIVSRPTYILGIYLILFVFFTGGFTFGKAFLSGPLMRAMGKLTFEAALITPLMIQLIYSQLPNGLFV